jgi:dipeptidyl aminopeptidase/acylaminoacyl peptidase
VARLGIGAVLAALLLAGCGGGGGHDRPAEHRLAYVAGDDPASATVVVSKVDGSHPRRLGPGTVAVLTPDGRALAVLRKDGVYVVSSRDSHARRLTRERLRPQTWSLDGSTLIASRPAPLSVLELDAIDRQSGKVRVLARGSLYGFSFSPDGSRLVYSRAPTATGQGLCGDQFDLYTAKLSGGEPERLTHDGLSAFPVWGKTGIAYARFPAAIGLDACSAPGIWTIRDDGSHDEPVIRQAPLELAQDGLFGLQPVAWLDDHRILAGIRTNAGTLGAVLDTRTHKLHRLPDFVDAASSDGRFTVGGGGDDQRVHLAIVRVRDARRVFLKISACCPSWNR